MGGLFAIPMVIINAVASIIEQGFMQWLYWAVTYLYLVVVRRMKGRRLDLYDFEAKGDPEKMAYFVPHQEWELESPQTKTDLEKTADNVFCFGVNSKSEYLSIRLARMTNSKVHCSLLLQLANGKSYTLPEQLVLQQQTEEPHTYGSSRLKMTCMLPLRKWRIFYNGMLRETPNNGDKENAKYIHVKFSFIWTASSEVFDFSSDISYSALANSVAAIKGWKWPISIATRIRRICNIYEQPGMLLGTVTVDGEEEKEVYLWGCRGHFMGQIKNVEDGSFSHIYSNAENGSLIHLGIARFPGIISKFYFGFAMQPNGFIFPIHKCDYFEKKNHNKEVIEFVCFAGERKYDLKIEKKYREIPFDNEFGGQSSLCKADFSVNGMTAKGLILEGVIHPDQTFATKKTKFPIVSTSVSKPADAMTTAFTLSFRDPFCKLGDVSGGKGSSLSKLTKMSEEIKTFTVPKGIVVTTAAYGEFIKGRLEKSLKSLESVVWGRLPGDSKAACDRVVKEVSNSELPESLGQAILRNLKKEFGDQINILRFAVRSSATGEDTEQMSAAGQMATFLGCTGIKEILTAVKKCWASQFAFVAVEYKRRYGQPINTPMAVVIQQMVPCDVAGVLFSCNPVNGNPEYITITANYGLGESVVSATAEPDTVVLKRDINNKLEKHSVLVGSKKMKIIMDGSVGTKEEKLTEEQSTECCLSEESAFKLGNIAIKVEDQYGGPRDIEWGMCGTKIYLLQARPVTSIDIESDFEIKHEMDTYLRREDEYASKANVGEVMPGSSSTLGLEQMNKLFLVATINQKIVKWEGEEMPLVPYYPARVIISSTHAMFCVADGFFKFSEGEGDEISNNAKVMSVSLFGRIIDDKKLFQIAKDRHSTTKKKTTIKDVFASMYIFMLMFFAGYFTKRVAKKLQNYRVPIEKSSARDILDTIGKHFHEITVAFNSHMDCTFSSPFWNQSVLMLLGKGEWDNEVFSDFAYLLSSCSQVESADVPATMQRLAFVIAKCIDQEKFKSMDVETALKWLQTSTSEAGIKYRDFIKKHGHRCLKEFDAFSQTWEMNPKPLIKMLQGFGGKVTTDAIEKKTIPFQTILSNLQVPLSSFSKILLWLLLPQCRRGVREREISKSLLIKAMNSHRQAYRLLANAMVKEGRLPNEDLLFFLQIEEINQLIKTRSPRLISKALRRYKVREELDKLIFPEITIGIPKPINMDDDLPIQGNSLTLTGVPVSQGTIKATARVVINLEDAPCIQPGDVLITYCTDIGWSPYFPLLSGIVTELGGLISHGAVVAREYGLPCVVNMHGATRMFKSGDKVLLDGTRGILQKLEDD